MIGRALGRMVSWALRRVGERNSLLLALLVMAESSLALGVADRVRGVEPGLALTMAVLGLVTGWLVGATGLRAWAAACVIGFFGAGAVFWRVGRLGDTLVRLSPAWVRLVRSIPQWLRSGGVLEWGPIWAVLTALGEDGATLVTRVCTWAVALTAGAPTFDPVAVASVWSLGLWAVSGWAAWLIYRRERPLWALVPAGVLLMLAFSHVWGSHIFLITLLLAGFLLLASVAYDRRIRRWEATDVDYPDLQLDMVMVTAFLSLSLVTAAQVVPSISLQPIRDLAREISGGRSEGAKAVAESLGMEERESTIFREVQTGGLPRRHLLGSGPELSETVVMIISTGDLPGGPPEAMDRDALRYAWRSHTYDQYVGTGWRTGETEAMAYAAGVPAYTQTLTMERVVRQEVRVVNDAGRLLHAAGTLMVADHDYRVAWRSPEDPFGATVRATSYRADSLVPIANEDGLRAAGSDYPAWVRERYLGLPESVPQRVLGLARDLTATEPTPYGRARAIETYLRRFPYTLEVPVPPGGRDVVDYFLFDLRKGYCDYYASAMTVLARAAGLPARLAVGYASGSYDWDGARYVVTEADAHAWPEIYFPSHGWVRFEPTAGLPPVEHTDEASSPTWAEPEEALEPAGGRWRIAGWTWWQGLMGGLVVLGLVAAARWGLDRGRLLHDQPAATVATLYRRLRRSGRRLKVPMQAGDTPLEFGAAFAGWLADVAKGWSRDELARGAEGARRGRLGATVAVGAEELVWLTGLYARASYSPRSPGADERARAVWVWSRLRWRLLLARLWESWQPKGE